jgi:hypothetical protein
MDARTSYLRKITFVFLVGILLLANTDPAVLSAFAATARDEDVPGVRAEPLPTLEPPSLQEQAQIALTLIGNDSSDYAIGKAGILQGQDLSGGASYRTFTWAVISGPSDDPDHEDEVICIKSTYSDIETCELSPLFFDADDIGKWTIQLSVDNGNGILSAELDITVQGYSPEEKKPTTSETGSVEPIAAQIVYDDWNFKTLLVYTNIQGVDYWDENPDDTDLPNGHREVHYMQPQWVPVLEKLVALAEEENIYLMLNDAWDQDNGHSEGSRHYEGRALDLDTTKGSTTQADEARLGRLAYLAEKALKAAGIERYWVYNETSGGHVHVSVDGDQAGNYVWAYQCEGSLCLNHQQQLNHVNSGSAVGSMIMDWLSEPVSQDEFFVQAGSPSNGISCDGMAGVLNSDTRIQWECAKAPSRDEAQRVAAFWIDWTTDYFGAGFPVAIPTHGDDQHWLAIEGVIASDVPTEQTTMDDPGGGNYQVGGFFVDDPGLNALHNDAKRFETKEDLEDSFLYIPSEGYEVLVATGCQSGSNHNEMVAAAATSASGSGYCGSAVWITEPEDGDGVDAGDSMTVKVTSVFGATNVELKVDGVAQSETFYDGISQHEFEWNVPSNATIGTSYNLQAFATVNGVKESSDLITVTVATGIVDPNPVSFIYPVDYQDDLIFDHAITVKVYAPNAEYVELQVSPSDFNFDGRMSIGTSGYWEVRWTPIDYNDDNTETYHLRALAFLPDNGGSNDSNITVYGRPENLDTEAPTIRFLNLTQNMVITDFTPIRVSVLDNDGISYVGLEIKSFGEEEFLETYVSCGSGCYEFDWKPDRNGRYTIDVLAYDMSSNSAAAVVDVEVNIAGLPDRPDTMRINQYAFLRYIKGLEYDRGWYGMGDIKYDTGIQSNSYVCSVVGFNAKDGDIGEAWDSTMIRVYLSSDESRSNPTWHLMADFNTFHKDWTGTFGGDRYETWDATLLCISSEVAASGGPQMGKDIFIESTPRMGDNVGSKNYYDTGYRFDEYACGIAGFDSGKGDINEDGDGDIIHTYLYQKDETWWVRADFRSHNNDENWRVDLLCANREWASLDLPRAGHPLVLKEYKNLGDNIRHLTDFAVEDWACGTVGFSARDGDINEDGFGDIIKVYLEPNGGRWQIRADFKTHNDNENWDVNVLCFHKDLSAAPEILSATPTLFTTRDHNNVLYGPGMALTWKENYHPEAKYYEIQFSEDGGTTWQAYADRREIRIGGWINHHGNLSCGFGFGRCLKRLQSYSYRIRVLDAGGSPITEWSDIFTANSMDWPAHVELADPSPPGPYGRNATVTLQVQNAYGKDLWLHWSLQAYGGASYSISSGCQSGYLYDASARTCTIRINKGSSAYSSTGDLKLAALAPVASVKVQLTGKDSLGDGYTDWDELTLHFRNDDPIESSFNDVPPEHWAYDYIETLYNDGYISGCATVGEPEFCPERALNRAEMAVLLVRSFHPDERGYVPADPPQEEIVFEDLKVEEMTELTSAAVTLEEGWCVKWAEELRTQGFTSGCNADPPSYCPFEVNSRAQATVFFERLLHTSDYEPPLVETQSFVDVPKEGQKGDRIWYHRWVEAALEDGVIQACGTDMVNNLFRPDEAITRAEAACMMYYALIGAP